MTVRLREVLSDLPTYKAGQRAAQREGLVSHKLSSNESPFPPPTQVLEQLGQVAVHEYPDPNYTALTDRLAGYLGVTGEQVFAGCGSVALCQNAVQIAADPGDEVVYAWRSFEAYPIVTRIASGAPVQVQLTPDYRHDVQRMAEAVTARTSLVFLCTPNNPTGPAITRQEVEWFLEQVPGDLLVVLDEAYHEYADHPERVDGLDLLPRHPNLMVLRTFSKAFGLAGLRVGYGVCHPEVATAMRKVATPFGVSGVAQATAIEALGASGITHMRESVATVIAERGRVRSGLREAGWDVPETQTNFVFVPTPRAAAIAAHLHHEGLTVRPFPEEGMRISIGSREANDRVLEALASGPGST